MTRHPLRLLSGVFALLALFASGCATTAPALTPQRASAVTATATPTPLPTNTPTPTNPPSEGETSVGGIFGPALEKAKSATSYRVEMLVTGKGNFGLGGSETPDPKATPLVPTNQEITMISLKGEVNGQDSHLSLQGLFTAFLGVDPAKSLEVVATGDKNYIHGPVSLIGATEDKWYELPAGESSVAKPPLTPNSFLDSFSGTGLDSNEFTKTGTESLDNRSCDVYSGDQAAIQKTFKGVGQAAGAADWSAIDNAELKFWICDDGYLHQVRLSVAGHVPDKPDQKGLFLMQMHIYDIGANIKIEAPTNAELLKAPSFINAGTPNP